MQLATFANNRVDPTQTSVLRARYASAMRRRFGELDRAVIRFILDNQGSLRAGEAFYDYLLADYLASQEEKVIFEGNEAAWMLPFVTAGILAGVRFADRQMIKSVPKINLPILPEANPILYRDEIDVILSQNFRLLKSVTEVMNLQIKEQLIRGIYEGLGPRDVAGLITGRISAIGKTRAELLSRTETIRAHSEATLSRYQAAGINEVTGLVEFLHSNDGRVCPVCSSLGGQTFTIQDARGRIPVHPRCRCAWAIAQSEVKRLTGMMRRIWKIR